MEYKQANQRNSWGYSVNVPFAHCKLGVTICQTINFSNFAIGEYSGKRVVNVIIGHY